MSISGGTGAGYNVSMTPTTDQLGTELLRMVVAYALSLPIGWNRERDARSAGLRTFPLVSLASCGLTLLGSDVTNGSGDALSRILQGLVTGIGFVGGGAILREKHSVSGTATAASVWNVGILGAASGLGYFHIAAVLSIVNFVTLQYLKPLKKEIQLDAERKRTLSGDALLDD